jgi:hypothetical protein
MRLWKQFALAIGMTVAAVTTADAGVITNGTVSVGVTTDGNLFDTGVGFRRNSDGLDPIAPGTPRESWGARLGGVSGRVDPAYFGSANVTNLSSSFAAASANTSTRVGTALQVDQKFSFVASNAMAIDVKMTNISGASGTAVYRRIGDWDISPTPFNETVTANARSGVVSNSGFYGFDSADPASALANVFAAGGSSHSGDNGGAIDLNFGTLANGSSTDFRLIYAISTPGQTEASLRAQLAALGAFYIISGRDNSTAGGVNFFALGVVAAVPEPASLTVFGAVAVGGVVSLLRRRKTAVA